MGWQLVLKAPKAEPSAEQLVTPAYIRLPKSPRVSHLPRGSDRDRAERLARAHMGTT
jgi:hypothetical protein